MPSCKLGLFREREQGSCPLSPNPPGPTGSALALQSFGLGLWFRGVLLACFFPPFTNVFHYNSRVFRHGKDIPDQQHTSPSDNVETSCFHKFSSSKLLCSEEFLSPCHLLPLLPTPPLAGQAGPGVVCASSSPGADAACSRRAWHETPGDAKSPRLWHGGNVTMAPVKGFGNCKQQRWDRQGVRQASSVGLQAAFCRAEVLKCPGPQGYRLKPGFWHWVGNPTEVGVLLAGWGPLWRLECSWQGGDTLRGQGAAGGVDTPSLPAPGSTPPGKTPGIPAPTGQEKGRDEHPAGAVPRPGPRLWGRAPTWYFGGFPCCTNPGLHPARHRRTCRQQRPPEPWAPAPAHPGRHGDRSALGLAMLGTRSISYLRRPQAHQDYRLHPCHQCQRLGALGRGVYQCEMPSLGYGWLGWCRRKGQAQDSSWGPKGTP